MEEKRNDNLKFPTVDEIQDECHYKYHMTVEAFNTIENPVIDTQGNLRGKNDSDILIGLHDRKPLKTFNNLTYIESAHIKHVQEDFVKFGEHYHNIYCGYKALELRCDKQSVELKDAIDSLKESKGYTNYLEKKNKKLKATIVENNQQIEALTTNNKLLTITITNLTNDNDNLPVKNSLFKRQIKNLEKIDFPKEAKAIIPGKFTKLVKKTFSTLTEKEVRENYLKLQTHGVSNYGKFFRTLKHNKHFINGRGTETFRTFLFSLSDKTPLIIAAEDGNMVAVKALIESGACPNYIDRDYKSALDYADEGDSLQHEEVANFLEDNGAKKARYLFNLQK